MVGRARLSTVRSRPTTSMLIATAISAHQRRAPLTPVVTMKATSFRLPLRKDSYCQIRWQVIFDPIRECAASGGFRAQPERGWGRLPSEIQPPDPAPFAAIDRQL